MIGFWAFMLVMDLAIPCMMVIFGGLFAKRPPQKINAVFGYRTSMSMKNKDTWDFAHRFFGKIWFCVGLILLSLSLIPLLLVLGSDIENTGTIGGIVCLVQLIPLILPIIPTEIALRKHFGKMLLRLADAKDLPQLKAMYRDIIQNMNDNQIQIWDDIYPCEFFEEDIKEKRMYVMLNQGKIISAFVLCDKNSGESTVKWQDNSAKALYLDRFGVNVNYQKLGMGAFTLEKAQETAKKLDASYLRLFVVDINEPAIRLYEKNGFIKADRIYDEVFDDGFVLHEYGYEIKL